MKCLLLLLLCFTARGFCQLKPAVSREFCALRVSVTDSKGAPVANTSVAVRRINGTIHVGKMTDRTGISEFCDLGLGPFDVEVGTSVCWQVFRSIYYIWPRERELRVIHENCQGHLPLGGCQVLLRLRGPDGSPISGLPVITDRGAVATDRYGRIFRWLGYRDEMKAGVEVPDYKSASMLIRCDHTTPLIEKELQLERKTQ